MECKSSYFALDYLATQRCLTYCTIVYIHSVYSLTHFPSIANSTSVDHALISVRNMFNPDTRVYAVWRGPSITVADPGSIAAAGAGARRGIDTWVSGEESG